MATLSFTIEGPNLGSLTVTRKIDDADAARMLAWTQAVYGPYTDEDGKPAVRDMEGAVTAYADGILAGTLANVVRFEEEQAVAVAKASITKIELSKE